MTRSLLLFAHINGMLALFVGLALEWICLNAVQRAATRDEGLQWVRLARVVPRLSGIAMATIIASGLVLGARVGVLGNAWMRVSYGALLLMAVVSGPVARSPIRALTRAADRPADADASTLRTAASNPILRLALRVRIAFGLAVVYLMIAKPDPPQSLLVMAIASVATIVTSFSGQTAQSQSVEGYQ